MKKNIKENLILCTYCGNMAPMIDVTSYERQILYGDPPYTDEDNLPLVTLSLPKFHKPILDEQFRSSIEMDID